MPKEKIFSIEMEKAILTDNQSLYDKINTTKQVSNERNRIEILQLRETQSGDQIETFCVKSCCELGDIFFKKCTIQKGILAIDH